MKSNTDLVECSIKQRRRTGMMWTSDIRVCADADIRLHVSRSMKLRCVWSAVLTRAKSNVAAMGSGWEAREGGRGAFGDSDGLWVGWGGGGEAGADHRFSL